MASKQSAGPTNKHPAPQVNSNPSSLVSAKGKTSQSSFNFQSTKTPAEPMNRYMVSSTSFPTKASVSIGSNEVHNRPPSQPLDGFTPNCNNVTSQSIENVVPATISLNSVPMDSEDCRGCSSDRFVALCKRFVRSFRPQILILFDPWISGAKADRVIRHLGFNFNIRQEAEGFSGGSWILWIDASINISHILKHRQFIHAKISSPNFFGFITAIYGSPLFVQRGILWEAFRTLTLSSSDPWLLAGDFNSFLRTENKSGGPKFT